MTGIQTNGPGDRRAQPCGCRVGSHRHDELDTEPTRDDELHIGWSVTGEDS